MVNFLAFIAIGLGVILLSYGFLAFMFVVAYELEADRRCRHGRSGATDRETLLRIRAEVEGGNGTKE